MHGFGHVSRCVALAEAFVSTAGGEPVFRTYSPDGAARRFIVDRGFAVEAAPASAGSRSDLESLRIRLANPESPRLLVIDSRDIDSDYCESLQDLAVVLCLDDEACRDLACDILVNSHPWISEEDYAPRPGRILLTGSRYNTLAPNIFHQASEHGQDSSVRRILITLGGEDPHDHTSWIIEACADLLAPYAVDIIVGPAHPDSRRVEAAVARHLPSANLVIAPSGLARFIAEADMAISAGGITCYELAAAHVPMLVVVVEAHQSKLVASLEEYGCLIRLGGYDDLSIDRVRQTIGAVLADKALRDGLSAAGSRLFEQPGGAAIAVLAAETIASRFPDQCNS